ncbi:MAG TPA: trypsin-like peptidase domain-containing protein [Verrucomicrobiae bacterium]|nr:trypsin-like peptidase domain-containing protein [Verrucomicrobiae bacterium]
MDREVSAIYEKSRAAIVKVHNQRLLQIGNLSLVPSHRIGTGFFIDQQGHLLTADTVVAGASHCWIEWNGQNWNARILGRDPQTNLALLQLQSPTNIATPFLPQGNSDEVHVGSMVIVIGFPYDLSSAPVVGFVGGLDIQQGGRVFTTSHIRAGCRLSPGEGGGPLLNTRGEVVGIAVAAHMDDQCYALPINAARKVYSDILQFGQPQHTWVGLGITERRSNSADTDDSQVIVQQIYSNAPAAAAGFCEGDVLERIGTNEVRHSADVLNTMFFRHIGDQLDFTVLRDGHEKKVSLVVAAQPADEPVLVHTVPEFSPFKPSGRPALVPASQEQ